MHVNDFDESVRFFLTTVTPQVYTALYVQCKCVFLIVCTHVITINTYSSVFGKLAWRLRVSALCISSHSQTETTLTCLQLQDVGLCVRMNLHKLNWRLFLFLATHFIVLFSVLSIVFCHCFITWPMTSWCNVDHYKYNSYDLKKKK